MEKIRTISTLEQYFDKLLIACLILMAILGIVAIVRSILGPHTTDRIIAVNMIGTLTIAMFAILAVYLGEDYLADVCLIYAMISFLAVVVLTKIFAGMYREAKLKSAGSGENASAEIVSKEEISREKEEA